MKPLTVVISYNQQSCFGKTLIPLVKSPLVERILIVTQGPIPAQVEKCHIVNSSPITSQETLNLLLDKTSTEYLLLLLEAQEMSIEPRGLERYLEAARSARVGLVYSDFYDERADRSFSHALNDYQLGSIRDEFDFGGMILFSVPAIREALKKCGPIPQVTFAGLYDLRLKISIDHSVVHIREPLYKRVKTAEPSFHERLFAYADPRHETAQKEMEMVFTDYLKKIGAYLPHEGLKRIERSLETYPVEASVIIPVKNRKETISQAVQSALSQETDFSFNVIAVDNHSTDGTTAILSHLAQKCRNLKHIVPPRTDLGIGGCWNEALRSEACGHYAVQLDSDDLYSSRHSLQRIIDLIRTGSYAMVIGSYTLVDFELREIPPGLINHREWTDENGHNNALRLNGLGAPRAFHTGLMRSLGFLNVSYGEDYAAALRICREYRIGRIYESLYLCRRWSGNTDADLSLEETNRNDAFKDKIRTEEILARQRMAKSIGQRA